MTNKKAPVPPPPSRSRLTIAPPVQASVPDNLSKPTDEIRDLNFKVSPDFHRSFKTVATVWGMSMKDLLEASFTAWVEKNGDRPKDAPDLFRGR